MLQQSILFQVLDCCLIVFSSLHEVKKFHNIIMQKKTDLVIKHAYSFL